jgi:hypothetical protein
MNFVDLISIDDIFSYLLDYCYFDDIISLYVLFLSSSRSPLSTYSLLATNIPKYFTNFHYLGSFENEYVHMVTDNLYLHNFFKQCLNIQNISLCFFSETETDFCELTFQHFLSMDLTFLKNITIIIPEDYPTSICELCSKFIQKLSTQRFYQIQSIKISFPAYKVNESPPLSHLSLNNCSESLFEIFGLESFDHLFDEISHQPDAINFLDLECWPNLKILHLGNLISRFFSILEDISGDFSSWIDCFLSKFTIIRFPSVATLDFDSLEDEQFLSFIRSLAEFLLPLSPKELDTYLWSSISNLIIDRLQDSSANRFALEEEWMTTIRSLRSIKSQLSSDSKRDGSLPSQSVLTLFPNVSLIRLFAPLPSSHFLSLSSSSCRTQTGLWLHGFHDDPILHQYLVTPSLHPLPVGITRLSIFERFCDYQLLQQRVPSFEKCRLMADGLPSSLDNSSHHRSFLDSLLAILPRSCLSTHLTPLCSKRLASSARYPELNQFLKYNGSSLSHLHINESHLRGVLLSEKESGSLEGEGNLFGNCHQLETVVIELDLFCRGEESTSAFGYLSRLVQCLGLKDLHQSYPQLRRLQFNVWTHDSEVVLQSFLLPQLAPSAAAAATASHSKAISIFIHNRCGGRDSRVGVISCPS